MSQRNWKSSNVRRRTGDGGAPGSVNTSSTSSTVSISNTTVESNTTNVFSILTPSNTNNNNGSNNKNDHYSVSSSTTTSSPSPLKKEAGIMVSPPNSSSQFSSSLSMYSNDSTSTNGNSGTYFKQEYDAKKNPLNHNTNENFDSNESIVSGISTASSVDTYDFAFTSSARSVLSAKRPRNNQKNASISAMPTLDESYQIDSGTSFLDTFLESNSSSSSTFDNRFGFASPFIHQGKQMLAPIFHKVNTFISSNNNSKQQQYQRNNNLRDFSSKYINNNKSTSSYNKTTPEWIWSILKILILISLMMTSLMALKLSKQNQINSSYAESVAGVNSASRPQSLKHKLFRRNNYPGPIFRSPNQNGSLNDPTTMMQNENRPDIVPPSLALPVGDSRNSINTNNDNSNNNINLRRPNNNLASQKDVRIPPAFLNLADIVELPVLRGQDLPFYWHIPRAGGTMMNDVLGACLGLQLASNSGGWNGHGHDETLQILSLNGFQYLNVDMSTPVGIERADKLHLVSSNLADVMISSLVYEGSVIFTPINHGRLFTVFRHPIERAVSLFHYTQDMVWRRGNVEDLMDITIEEYFKGGMGENNWMTRFLANAKNQVLTEYHLNVAKEVLRQKCLVGLLTEKGESMSRFLRYFGWDEYVKGEKEEECIDKNLDYAWPQKHRHEDVEEGSEVWNLILQKNVFDLQLFEYAKVLFREQSRLFMQ